MRDVVAADGSDEILLPAEVGEDRVGDDAVEAGGGGEEIAGFAHRANGLFGTGDARDSAVDHDQVGGEFVDAGGEPVAVGVRRKSLLVYELPSDFAFGGSAVAGDLFKGGGGAVMREGFAEGLGDVSGSSMMVAPMSSTTRRVAGHEGRPPSVPAAESLRSSAAPAATTSRAANSPPGGLKVVVPCWPYGG